MIVVSDPGTKAIEKARAIHAAGAHFLLGTRGETPAPANGRGFRLFEPTLDPVEPVVNAARGHDKDLNPQICVGRPLHPDIRKAGGGKQHFVGGPSRATTRKMRDYIRHVAFVRDVFGAPQERWPSFKVTGDIRLTPRTFFDTSGNPVVMLGEECFGKMHVDCIGLVNLCLTAGRGSDTRFGISQIEKGTAFGTGSIVFARTSADPEKTRPGRVTVHDGDIVIKHEFHIGICGVTKSGLIEVIEATGSDNGIIRTTFQSARALDTDKWRTRIRPFR